MCSESVYNRIKNLRGKFIEMPTCGLYCSTAIGRKKQMIKVQCMLPVRIGEKTEEIVF